MSLDDSSERVLGTTLAGILVTLATICLTIMWLTEKGYLTKTNELFGFLGLGSLLTSTLILDAILDKANCSFPYRLKDLLNGGYFLFTIVMSVMSFSILYLYYQQQLQNSEPGSLFIYLLFSACSIIQWLKLMLGKEEKFILVFILGILFIVSIAAINLPKTH